MRAHQAITATTSAIVLMSTLGLGLFSSIVSHNNTQLATLNRQLDDRNLTLDQKNTELITAIERETASRKQAEEQSQLALATLNNVVFDLQGGLRNIPGGGDVRRRLLRTSLAQLEQVATEFASKSSVDRTTMVAFSELGDVLLRFGDPDESETPFEDTDSERQTAIQMAMSLFRKANEIAKQLLAADPSDSQSQRDLMFSHYRIGSVHTELLDFVTAGQSFQSGIEVLQTMIDKKEVLNVETSIAALQDWDKLQKASADQLSSLLLLRAVLSVKKRHWDEALQAVAKVRSLKQKTAYNFYDAACIYSICAAAPGQQAKRDQCLQDAVATLQEAIAAGYDDFDRIAEHSAFDPLRDLPEFKALLPKKPE